MKRLWKPLLAVLLLCSAAYAAEINSLSTTDASNTARFPESMAPSQVNNAARALEGILARWFKDQNGSLTSGGSADTYTLSANQTLSSYYQGLRLSFDVNATNTGPSTLNVDSIGAATITKYGGVELDAGDIGAGDVVTVVYDGTNFQLVSAISPYASTVTNGNLPIFYGTTGKFTDSGYGTTGVSALDSAGITAVNDEDDMASDSATALATQQSIKAYVDTNAGLTNGTSQATTSGTAITFSSIPAGTKLIRINFVGVSTDGTNAPLIRLGDSGGVETSGYLGAGAVVGTGTTQANYTTGCGWVSASAANVIHGTVTFSLEDNTAHTWVGSGILAHSEDTYISIVGCSKSLSGELTQVQIYGGGDNFDAGKINIQYR